MTKASDEVLKMPQTRVGLLGGSFDPIHRGHLHLAQEVLNQLNLDEVRFIPAFRSPHKTHQSITPAHHRAAMIELALSDHPHFTWSNIELERAATSYTVDTLESLCSLEPDTRFILILGQDAFKKFILWKQYERILQRVDLAVATRPGSSQEETEQALLQLNESLSEPYIKQESTSVRQTWKQEQSLQTIYFLDIPPLDISSSAIREGFYLNSGIKKMLPPQVDPYIMSHQLYQ